MKELSRQLVHLSGVLFVIVAQFTQKEVAAAYFFLIALTFLLYAFHIKKARKSFSRLLDAMDKKVRGKVLSFEREGPLFQGVFWFYFSCGLVFLLFPKDIATVACLVLAVSDSLATIIGYHLGRNRFRGKSVEGSMAFLISAFAVAYLIMPEKALIVALAGFLGELAPEIAPKLRKRGLLDDNLLIPLFVAIALKLF